MIFFPNPGTLLVEKKSNSSNSFSINKSKSNQIGIKKDTQKNTLNNFTVGMQISINYSILIYLFFIT